MDEWPVDTKVVQSGMPNPSWTLVDLENETNFTPGLLREIALFGYILVPLKPNLSLTTPTN